MKSSLLLTALSTLAACSAEAEPKAEPQILAFLGGNCLDACPQLQISCTGSICDCRNTQSIECYLSSNAGCILNIETCPAIAGITPKYPPCGFGQAPCVSGRTCYTTGSGFCLDPLGAGICPGLCIPEVPSRLQQLTQTASQIGQNIGQTLQNLVPVFGNSQPSCNTACGSGKICVANPRNQLPGQNTVCVSASGVCGGWAGTLCPGNGICVPDPRNNCSGQGCTGLCV